MDNARGHVIWSILQRPHAATSPRCDEVGNNVHKTYKDVVRTLPTLTVTS